MLDYEMYSDAPIVIGVWWHDGQWSILWESYVVLPYLDQDMTYT